MHHYICKKVSCLDWYIMSSVSTTAEYIMSHELKWCAPALLAWVHYELMVFPLLEYIMSLCSSLCKPIRWHYFEKLAVWKEAPFWKNFEVYRFDSGLLNHEISSTEHLYRFKILQSIAGQFGSHTPLVGNVKNIMDTLVTGLFKDCG